MANLMGSWAVWVKDGVVQNRNPVNFPFDWEIVSRRGYYG